MSPPQTDPPVGFLAIDKPAGWTSHDIVAKVRRLSGVRRVGHAGTLDPFATGLLVVAVGQATRLLQYAQNTTKEYRATLRLGLETDTLDPEGKVTEKMSSAAWPDDAEIAAVVAGFSGTLQQVPPSHSAVHVQGRRAYELARAGEAVNIPSREVTIHSIAVTQYAPPFIDIAVSCSTGTYIRSLARDIGLALKTYAYCHSLRRTRSGAFDVDDAFTIGMLEAGSLRENWPEYSLPADMVVQSFERIVLSERQSAGWYHGQSLVGFAGGSFEGTEPPPVRVYDATGRFAGLGFVDEGVGLRPTLVFVTD